MTKFSIIVPAYNSAWCIRRCIDSVLSQTCSDWEIIVVNNFSTDDTVKIINSYNDNRIHLINNANHGIIANARNRGIELAKGEWICFLDSDDWWTSDKLEQCLPFLMDYDMIYHDLYRYKDGKISKRNLGDVNKRVLSIECLLLGENQIANSSVLVRKEIITEVGPLSEDPKLVTVEDLDFWIRILHVTPKVKCVDMPLVYYWIGNNTSGSIRHAYAERALLAKYISEISPAKRDEAKSLLSYKMARVFHLNEKYREAIVYYCGSFLSKYKIKAILLLLFALLRIKR